ncbi:FkbM family methyltransferase [Kiloniella laminariae]|uniref:FkbM family methyltransferase n=1 Tax=Kiloniella laminariae TaxID=454162 RepID=UPI000380FBB6|nr:FkbM family methyltransferase [Kiloniella laminariae]
MPSAPSPPRKELIIPSGTDEAKSYKITVDKLNYKTVGASSIADDPSQSLYEEWAYIPTIYHKDFSNELLRIINKYKITAIFCPHYKIFYVIEETLKHHSIPIELSPPPTRQPILEQALHLFNSNISNTITDIIDIGVQFGTPFLIKSFPLAKHHLVEPVAQYYEKIKSTYTNAGIEYSLLPYALSDLDGEMILHEYDLHTKGTTSHSSLRPQIIDHPNLYKTSAIKVRNLDSLFSEIMLKEHDYIVKIDVDGLEDKIISGGYKTIRNAAAIIIESPLHALSERLQSIQNLGFSLWDICDPAYYHEQLSQVDLVFINKIIERNNISFRPWDQGPFSLEKWQSI